MSVPKNRKAKRAQAANMRKHSEMGKHFATLRDGAAAMRQEVMHLAAVLCRQNGGEFRLAPEVARSLFEQGEHLLVDQEPDGTHVYKLVARKDIARPLIPLPPRHTPPPIMFGKQDEEAANA